VPVRRPPAVRSIWADREDSLRRPLSSTNTDRTRGARRSAEIGCPATVTINLWTEPSGARERTVPAAPVGWSYSTRTPLGSKVSPGMPRTPEGEFKLMAFMTGRLDLPRKTVKHAPNSIAPRRPRPHQARESGSGGRQRHQVRRAPEQQRLGPVRLHRVVRDHDLPDWRTCW